MIGQAGGRGRPVPPPSSLLLNLRAVLPWSSSPFLNMGPHNNQLGSNLPQLQNLIKRDPESYHEEFIQQLRHFESSLQIFLLNPAADAAEFGELVTFMSHV